MPSLCSGLIVASSAKNSGTQTTAMFCVLAISLPVFLCIMQLALYSFFAEYNKRIDEMGQAARVFLVNPGASADM
jgi:hypothetical protein